MRTTLNMSFPDDLYLLICDRVRTEAYATTSEYIRALVREDLSKSGGRNRKRPKTSRARRMDEIMAEPLIEDQY